jgi:hypothetical protein
VTSDVGGIDCGTNCLVSLPAHTVITLTAQRAGGSLFGGWGTAACVITPNAELIERIQLLLASHDPSMRTARGRWGRSPVYVGNIACDVLLGRMKFRDAPRILLILNSPA